jgi:hypothetical protein
VLPFRGPAGRLVAPGLGLGLAPGALHGLIGLALLGQDLIQAARTRRHPCRARGRGNSGADDLVGALRIEGLGVLGVELAGQDAALELIGGKRGLIESGGTM